MSAIDLYDDFNEEDDARMGDFEEEDQENREENNKSGDDENSAAANDGKVDVDPGIKVKKIRKKLVTLNAERLKGPRGIIAIDDFFKNIKMKGKGYEKEDLDEVLRRLEHWSHRFFPKYHFDDALNKIENLGRKKEIAVHMSRYRLDQLVKDTDDNRVLSDNDEMMEDTLANELPVDEFEELLNQQIGLSTRYNATQNTSLNMSAVSSSTQIPSKSQQQPTVAASQSTLTDEQRAKIEENRKRALEIRAAKLKEAEEQRKKQQAVMVEEVDDDEFDELIRQQEEMVQAFGISDKSDRMAPSQDMISTSTQGHNNHQEQQSSQMNEEQKPQLSDEQRSRIEENRKKAMAIRAAKLREIEEQKMKEKEPIMKITMNIDDDYC